MPKTKYFRIRSLRKEARWGVFPIWWCPGGLGYTDEAEDAGVWVEAEARAIVADEGPETLALDQIGGA